MQEHESLPIPLRAFDTIPIDTIPFDTIHTFSALAVTFQNSRTRYF